MTSQASVSTTRRYASLDGLRGAAAMIVVVTHLLICIPSVSDVIWDRHEPAVGSAEFLLFRTPAVLFTLGDQAVMIFFVMSGFVLAVPMLGAQLRSRATLAYYGRRLVRLYVPVWAALVFAAALAVAVPRNGDGGAWLASHPQPTLSRMLRDGVLLLGTSNLNSPLWSLTWEMWFSLLLPLMVLAYRTLRVARWWLPCVALLVVISAVSRWSSLADILPASWLTVPLLRYLPVFAIGILLAAHREQILRWGENLSRPARNGLAAGTALLLIGVPMLAPLEPGSSLGAIALWGSVVAVSSAVVLLALVHPTLSRGLESPAAQWAGKHSFSLYLTHEPIIVSAAVLVGVSGWWPWVVFAFLLIVVSLLVSAGFYRVVEKPSHRLSRTVGRALQGRRRAA